MAGGAAQLVVNGWFWGQMTTGSGQYLHHLVRCLPEAAGASTLTLVLPALGNAGAQPPAGWNRQLVSTPFDHLSANLAKVWFEQVGFPGACRRVGGDVAFTPYWGSSWRRPCRTAVTVHDLIPLLLPAYRGGLPQRLYTRLVRATARRADVVLTDSQASRRDIVEHLGVPPAGAHAVLLAADERYRRVVDEAELARVREKHQLPARFMLYLGGFDVRKNVPAAVRAYARFLKDNGFAAETPRLVIAGRLPSADTAFAPDPRQAVAEEGVADWVRFTGWVDEADKPALYSLAALFLFPSLYEGFGLPVAEAAACGTPVVTSNSSSLPEAGPGAVLVDPRDVGAIAAGLARALSQASQWPASPPARTWRAVARETWQILVAGEGTKG